MFKRFFNWLFHRKSKYNDKLTSKEVATRASRILRDKSATPEEKKVAASALAQAYRVESKQTSEEVTALSARMVRDKDNMHSDDVSSVAGSVLAQSRINKKKKKK